MFGDSDSEPPEGEQRILLVFFRVMSSNRSCCEQMTSFISCCSESEEDVEELERVHSPEVAQDESAGYYEQSPW